MNVEDWIVLLQPDKPMGLSEEKSYPKLIEMMREFEEERGHSLTDKQVDALQSIILSLIEAGACLTYYQDE